MLGCDTCVQTAVQGLVPQPGDGSDFPRMAAVNVEVLDRRDVIIGTLRGSGLPTLLTVAYTSFSRGA